MLQNNWMPQYFWQNKWPLPQKLPQPQPSLQLQSANFTQITVPNYHYPQTIVPPVPTYEQACTTMPMTQQQASIPIHAQTVNPQYYHNTTSNHTAQSADRNNQQQPSSSRVDRLNLPPRMTAPTCVPACAWLLENKKEQTALHHTGKSGAMPPSVNLSRNNGVLFREKAYKDRPSCSKKTICFHFSWWGGGGENIFPVDFLGQPHPIYVLKILCMIKILRSQNTNKSNY